MRRNPKIRLTEKFVRECMMNQRIYGASPSEQLQFTPIIYKVPFWDGFRSKRAMYQRRIMVRLSTCGMLCLRFRGRAPIHKAFTLEEFIDKFYAIRDEKDGTIYFKYYNK